jgi:spore coat polysaccharide biosynthesis protein SpsF (cytidylyltransferase family)
MFESNAFERGCDRQIEKTIEDLCRKLDSVMYQGSEKDLIIERIVKLRSSLNPTVVVEK